MKCLICALLQSAPLNRPTVVPSGQWTAQATSTQRADSLASWVWGRLIGVYRQVLGVALFVPSIASVLPRLRCS